jgi:hypothetical protein
MLMNPMASYWTNGNKKPAISNGFFTSLDFLGSSLRREYGFPIIFFQRHSLSLGLLV